MNYSEKRIQFNIIPGKMNPTTGINEFTIEEYWYHPPAFDVEFLGKNEEASNSFVEGETGALKRHLIHCMMLGIKCPVEPFSLLVCIENLQNYYKEQINKLEMKEL